RAEGLNLTVNVPWRFTLDIAGSGGHIEPRAGWYGNFGLPVERERRVCDRAGVEQAITPDPVYAAAPGWVLRLVLAADLSRIARPIPEVPDGRSVIAGYPWFGDWGRDTMISLPGLCLATGRVDEARLILETFARFVDGGMLPNVFPGAGDTPEYNTVDAALWYVEAGRAYIDATGDDTALRQVFPVLQSIAEHYTGGTRYGIAV